MDTDRAPLVDPGLRQALDGLETRLEDMEAAYADTQWRTLLGENGRDDLSRCEVARSALLLDTKARADLCAWESRTSDPHLARRLALLRRRFDWATIESQPEIYQLRNHIDQAIVGFRPGAANSAAPRMDRTEILRSHPDRSVRREAWMAAEPLAVRIDGDVRRLMRRRQDLARALGYDGFPDWALAKTGLRRQWVEQLIDGLYALTDSPYQMWLADAARDLSSVNGLYPWDLAFAAENGMSFSKDAFPSGGLLREVQAVARGLGLAQAAAGVQVDVADIPYAALCYAVRPPDDVRILVDRRVGYVHHDVLFHEFGHAMHWRCQHPDSPVLRWESPSFNEAMACLWERLALEPDSLGERDGTALWSVTEFRRQSSRRRLYRLRQRMAQTMFEYRAYEALDDDLERLYRKIFSKYLCVPYDRTPGWAASPFWTSHPLYLQNYVIGEAVASQTINTLKRQFGRLINNRHVGSWLVRNYYRPAASIPWTDKVAQATNRPLSITELAAELRWV